MKRFPLLLLVVFLVVLVSGFSRPLPAAEEGVKKEAVDKEEEEAKKALEAARKAELEAIRKKLPPIKMIYIKGGCFKMGDFTGKGDEDERPVHDVCLSDYYLSETEVTEELWQVVMGFPSVMNADKKNPASHVDWFWTNRFINKLNEVTGRFYRMPTEAEWEYAARERGKNIRWPGTDNEEELEDYAWMAYNSDGKIHHVKTKKPNALGLYDMAGNVWEWVEDYFDFEYYKNSEKEDPFGPDFSIWRGLRGGSALEPPYKLRTTYRYATEPKTRGLLTGIRLAE